MTTWQVTMDKLSDTAKQLMAYFSYLAPDNIPISLFHGDNQRQVEEAVDELVLYSMVNRNQDTASVHRLVQLVSREIQKNKFPVEINSLLEMLSHGYWQMEQTFLSALSVDEAERLYLLNSSMQTHVCRIKEHLNRFSQNQIMEKIQEFSLKVWNICLQKLLEQLKTSLGTKIFQTPKKISDSLSLSETIKNDYLNALKELKEYGISQEMIKSSSTALLIATKIKSAQNIEEIMNVIFNLLRWEDLETHEFNFYLDFFMDIDEHQIFNIVSTVTQIDSSQRREVIEVAQSLFESDMDRMDKISIIRAVVGIDSSQRREVIEVAQSLFESDMNGTDKASIIDAIAAISPFQRPEVLEMARYFFTPFTSGFYKGNIIKAVVDVDPSQRREVLEVAQSLLNPYMNGLREGSIMEEVVVFVCSPLFERKEVGEIMSEYLSILINGGKFADVIKAVGSVDPSQRQNFIEIVRSLFTPDMNGEDKVSLIKTVAGVDPSQRREVIEVAQSLFTPDMNGTDKASLIKAVASVDPSQRKEVIEISHFSFTSDMYGYYLARTIESIAGIDPSQRREVIEVAQFLFTPTMDWKHQNSIIQSIAESIYIKIDKAVC